MRVPGLRSVASVLAVEAGQWSEPEGRPGVARLTAQAMLRGTQRRGAKEWTEALDALGAVGRLDVGGHGAFFSGQCLAPDLGAYLRLVGEATLHPALADDELELVRAQTLAQLEEDERDTRAVADRTWRELAYPERHPFRTRALGDAAVVRTATADELRAFHSRSVLAGPAHLVIAGSVEPAAAFAAATEAFGEWPQAGERAGRTLPPLSLSGALRRDVVVPDKTQCDVVLGWHGLPRTDPRFVPARVTNMVFAADTFASRAGFVIRDQLGLAYYVFSTLGTSRGQAPWAVRMGVNPQNVERAIGTAFAELRKIHEGDVADDDLALAKDKLVGELDVALESPGGVAQLVLEAELFDLGAEHFIRYPGELRAVTKEQVVETARSFLGLERYALAVAGPPLG
ncbi:MAG TPA: pitrilysin family protein [Candidatus Limnocylindria bacterium]|nr:pitrilysin family protein [Candidatus Limnocylindria bacterium]